MIARGKNKIESGKKKPANLAVLVVLADETTLEALSDFSTTLRFVIPVLALSHLLEAICVLCFFWTYMVCTDQHDIANSAGVGNIWQHQCSPVSRHRAACLVPFHGCICPLAALYSKHTEQSSTE
jgi:hypothetical protein